MLNLSMIRRSSTAMLLLAVTTTAARAQDASANSANCDRAARGVIAQPLPAPGTDGWNHFMALTSCGSRGATVIAGVIQSPVVRAETDPARLDALAGMLDGWFAPSLVSAYETVVAAPEASPAMRLRAMWLLSGLLAPSTEVAGPLQGYTAVGCGAYERVTALRNAPASLPQQAYDDARLAFARAASDPTAPDAVRGTARCWSDAVAGRANAGSSQNTSMDDDRTQGTTVVNQTVINNGPPPVTVIEPIEVRYECDGRFVILNQGPSMMNLRYEIDGYGYGGYVQVGGRGSHVLVAARVGPLRFYIGNREVAYVRYVRRSCYGWRDGYTVVVASRMYYPRPVIVQPRPVVVVRPQPVIVGGRDRDRDRDRSREREPERGRDRDRSRDSNRDGNREPERAQPLPRGGDAGRGGDSNGGRTAVPRDGHAQAAPTIASPRAPNPVRTIQPQSGRDGGDGKKDEGRGRERRPQ